MNLGKKKKHNSYIMNWTISFLNNRKQRVVVDGLTTESVSINRGVPQGTVLGQFLFSIMVNGIAAVNPKKTLFIKFADDITLSTPTRPNTEDPSISEVQNIKS